MIWQKNFLFIFFTCHFLICAAQAVENKGKAHSDTNAVNSLLQLSKENFNTAPDKAIDYGMQASKLAQKINFYRGWATALKNIGIAYYNQGKYIEALDYWHQSLNRYELNKDNIGVANLLNNIGAVYFNQGDDAKALEYYLKSLKVSEQTGDKLRILSAMNNIGGVYFNKPATHNKALHYFLKALPLSEQLGDKEAIGTTAVNLGEIYFDRGNDSLALLYFKKSLKAFGNSENSPYTYNDIGKVYEKKGDYNLALDYHTKAYSIAKKLNGQLDMVQSLIGMANTMVKKGDNSTALQYFKEAESTGKQINALYELKNVYEGMAALYYSKQNYSQAYLYQKKFSAVKDSLYNIETDKKLGTLQFDFDLQKKQAEIDLLTKDKTLQDLDLKKQRFTRNALLTGLILVFIIAFILYRNYLAKVKVNKILDRQKEEIEGLLLNILPWEVAKELQLNGHAKSRNYESVTVLFADFIGFTGIADMLPPEKLVEELNSCFMAFDNIIDKYNIEKIKTIGDSYMCAGGIPVISEKHAYHIVKASLEIQDYIINNNRKRTEAGLIPWNLRIGIHVGPVVAGVVGKKKYAYDIWGSTVNIASRMESNGVAGRVNISATTYEMIKDKFICSHRGKVYAKNVGEIDMYFVDSEINNSFENQDAIRWV